MNTLIIGAIVGVLCEAQSILIIYLNASTFDTVSRLKDKTPYPVALTALGINVLTFFIGLLLIFIGGFFVGRIAVQRRLGFVAGFIAGLIRGLPLAGCAQLGCQVAAYAFTGPGTYVRIPRHGSP